MVYVLSVVVALIGFGVIAVALMKPARRPRQKRSPLKPVATRRKRSRRVGAPLAALRVSPPV